MNAGAAFTAGGLAYAGDALLIAAAELRLMFITRPEFCFPTDQAMERRPIESAAAIRRHWHSAVRTRRGRIARRGNRHEELAVVQGRIWP
jgi:hypothetical protein